MVQADRRMAMDTNADTLIRRAVVASLAAGQDILTVYKTPFNVEFKSDLSPVTEADRKAGVTIAQHLSSTNIPILNEEGPEVAFEHRKDWKQCWIVDPLDGTKEFVNKNGEFTVNIALVEYGIPTMGVIYVPVTDILYYGGKTMGIYRCKGVDFKDPGNGTPLPIKSESRPYTAVASRSHRNAETEEYLKALKEKYPDLQTITGGSSLKFALVAEGLADEYPRFGPTMEWDTAAGHALVLAAGKQVVSHVDGMPLRYNRENLRNPSFLCK